MNHTTNTIHDLYKIWNIGNWSKSNMSILEKIINYALLAANTHNIQPWKLKVCSESDVLLFIDDKLLLPETDPDHRHFFVSQGTFIATFQIAAEYHGYNTLIEYFPHGEIDHKEIGAKPVARLQLLKNECETASASASLFPFITQRHTPHYPLSKVAISPEDVSLLEKASNSTSPHCRILDSSFAKKHLNDLLVDAMEIQTANDPTFLETIGMMRFTTKDILKHENGFALENMGITGIKRRVLQAVLNERLQKSSLFKQNIVKATKTMVQNSGGLGVIYTKSDSRIDQIKAGISLAKVQLTATKQNIGLQPMDHALQKYDALRDIENCLVEELKFKDMVPQCLFRIGYFIPNKHKVFHTPRKLQKQFLV